MKLSDLPTGEKAVIISVAGHGAFRKRIIEMGFVKGKEVKSIKNAPLNDPIEYKILDYYVSLRREEAAMIDIAPTGSITAGQAEWQGVGVADDGNFGAAEQEAAPDERHTIKVALVGNPNCGKTTIFNHLGGVNEHTGNYSGVTVGATSTKITFGNYHIELIDLPGTYSISAYSPEETFVRETLINEDPDIVLNVVDSTNLARNLYLTTQLIEMGQRMVIALNMFDDFERGGDKLDYVQLGRMLGIGMVPTVGSKGKGMNALMEKIIGVYEGDDHYVRRVRIRYNTSVDSTLHSMCDLIERECRLPVTIPARYMAIKLLENDDAFAEEHLDADDKRGVISTLTTMRDKLAATLNCSDMETYMTDLRYGFIDGALNETFKSVVEKKHVKTQFADKILTHKLLGIPIFVAFIWIMFECTFTLGAYPMDWIEAGVGAFGNFMAGTMPDGPVKDLLVDGIIQGVGGVIVFLPNILILFLFISFMEDTGYMARAAFIMDKLMHKMGLHGKSFIPLIMGFGCSVPAVMATRTIEDRNNRMLTMLVTPLMSCSARLPVYILFCGAFFPQHAGTVLFSIYLFGVLMAVVMCRIFKEFLFKGQELPFVMELPPYRMPTLRGTLINMWSKASQYLKKMGGVIMVASIIIWFLGYYPQNHDYDTALETELGMAEADFASIADASAADTEAYEQHRTDIENYYAGLRQEYSFIGRIGKFIEPAIEPLGFDWKMGISLISGVAAKEIVVSSLAVLYGSGDDEAGLIENMRKEQRDGQPFFSTGNVLAFLVFSLVYFPCVATLVAIKNESGYCANDTNLVRRRHFGKSPWRWAIFVAVYTTILAWLLAWLVYHIVPLVERLIF